MLRPRGVHPKNVKGRGVYSDPGRLLRFLCWPWGGRLLHHVLIFAFWLKTAPRGVRAFVRFLVSVYT